MTTTHSSFHFTDGPYRDVDLVPLAHELLASEVATREGRVARTLAKGPGLTTVLTVVRAGSVIKEHAAPAPVVIIPVLGVVTFVVGDDAGAGVTLTAGRVLHIAPEQKHRVTADEDSAFLIVIGARG